MYSVFCTDGRAERHRVQIANEVRENERMIVGMHVLVLEDIENFFRQFFGHLLLNGSAGIFRVTALERSHRRLIGPFDIDLPLGPVTFLNKLRVQSHAEVDLSTEGSSSGRCKLDRISQTQQVVVIRDLLVD